MPCHLTDIQYSEKYKENWNSQTLVTAIKEKDFKFTINSGY
jgi:hypothetical protein